MVLFPVIGLLLWIAFLFAVMVLAGIVWAVCNSALWLMELKVRLSRPKAPVVSKRQNVPRVPHPIEAAREPEIWPKWNAAHRQSVDRELSVWQEQFDALTSRRL
jgi:hypothetical protein